MNSMPTAALRSPDTVLDAVRLDALDATRAFALLLGVVFHASLSFVPVFMGWAVQDVSTSPWVTGFTTVSHSFRMELFFLLAGFLARNTVQRRGAREFLRTRLIRMGIPFLFGWFLLRPLLVSGWIVGSMGLRGTVDVPGALWGGVLSLSNLPIGLYTGTHLWFLYYLALITGIAVGVRWLLSGTAAGRESWSRRADAMMAWIASTPGSILWLAIPTAVLLGFMQGWSVDTPDRSLRPHLPVLLLYGGCFGLGWMLGRQRDLLARFAKVTPMRILIACLGIGAVLWLGALERDPAHPRYLAAHVGYAMAYALTLWSLVFLTLGIFGKWCSRPNAAVRYVADSSYWMYLIHLPIVLWLQVAVAEWALHWSLKLTFVSVVTVGMALLTYDLGVRSTRIGQILNGRRRDRVLIPWLLGRRVPRTAACGPLPCG
ncbi:MAG: acyltransferase family protein [Verrucomicrobiales bacterium]|nr:acyltransferase family protein [Verrucomicrobiales bacterium]